MKRKNFLIVFSAVFFIALLAVATAPTAASPTNNWGVEEGDTLTYKEEDTFGDHSTVYEYEVTVVKIADLDAPTDDLDDLFYTEKTKLEGSEWGIGDGRLSGASLYDAGDIIAPDYPYILPIEDAGPGVQGLDWADAKSDIEAWETMLIYDRADVTEDGDMFKVELEDHGTYSDWGDWVETLTVEWDKSKGTLESFLLETVYDDVGLTEKYEITKGSIDGGLVSPMILAGAALGLAVLALLIVLIKK